MSVVFHNTAAPPRFVRATQSSHASFSSTPVSSFKTPKTTRSPSPAQSNADLFHKLNWLKRPRELKNCAAQERRLQAIAGSKQPSPSMFSDSSEDENSSDEKENNKANACFDKDFCLEFMRSAKGYDRRSGGRISLKITDKEEEEEELEELPSGTDGIDGVAAPLEEGVPAIPQNIRDIISQSNRNRKKNKQKKKVCIESSKKGEGSLYEEGKERSGVD